MARRNGNAAWTGDLKTGSGELTVDEGICSTAYSASSRFAGILPVLEGSADRNVHGMGGARVVQQAFEAGLFDSLHLNVAPVVIGAGTRLFNNLSDPIDLERTEIVASNSPPTCDFASSTGNRPER
jgi:dihydrofolate reductase